MTKHRPFKSPFVKDFELVEQRDGNIRRYPHTEQLPRILQAVKKEFYSQLPRHWAQVDRSASDRDKYRLRILMRAFSIHFNAFRTDELGCFSIYDADLVPQLAVVQKITEHTMRGAVHTFSFYTGPGFHQELYLAGRRLRFSDHCIRRFFQRIPQAFGDTLTQFLNTFFCKPYMILNCNYSTAFAFFAWDESLLIFPFHDDGSEFVVLTTLSAKETKSLRPSLPVHFVNLGFGPTFTGPLILRENLREAMERMVYQWARGVKGAAFRHRKQWPSWAQCASSYLKSFGGINTEPGMRLEFCGGVTGPCGIKIDAGQTELYDEVKDYERVCPGHDWQLLVAQRDSPGYLFGKSKLSIPYHYNPDRVMVDTGWLDDRFMEALNLHTSTIPVGGGNTPAEPLGIVTNFQLLPELATPKFEYLKR